jgi:hypothetical protein
LWEISLNVVEANFEVVVFLVKIEIELKYDDEKAVSGLDTVADMDTDDNEVDDEFSVSCTEAAMVIKLGTVYDKELDNDIVNDNMAESDIDVVLELCTVICAGVKVNFDVDTDCDPGFKVEVNVVDSLNDGVENE